MAARHEWSSSSGSGSDDGDAFGHVVVEEGVGGSSSDSDAEVDAKREAEDKFLDNLVDLYTNSTLSALAFCQLCYWAGKGGMGPRVAKYGKAPGLPTGHYQRHLNAQFGFNDARRS